LIGIIAIRDFIFQDGYLFLAEQYEVYDLDQFIGTVYPVWSDKLQSFNFADLTRLYIVLPLSMVLSIFGGAGYKIIQAVLLAGPVSIAFISSFKLTQYVTSKFTENHLQMFVSSLLAAFVFTISPWVATNPRNFMFRLEYAVFPLSVFCFLKILHTNEKKYVVYLALILSIFMTYRSFLLTVLVFAIIFLLFILSSKRKEIFSKLVSISIVLGLVSLLSAAKFLPPVLHSSEVTPDAVETFSTDIINRESISHIFTSKIVEWRAIGSDLTYDDNLHLFYIGVSVFGFLYLLLLSRYGDLSKKQYFFVMFPPVIYLLFLFLSAEQINIDDFLLNESNPLYEELGRLLRHARWNVMPMMLSLAVMVALSAMVLSKLSNRKYAYVPVAAFLIITSSISAWPIFSGDMNGYWQPSKPPEDYVQLNTLLGNEGDDHHIVWFPHYYEKAIWSNSTGARQTAAPTGIFAIRSSELPSYMTSNFYFFDYYNPVRGTRGSNPLPVYQGNLSKIYEPLNIKYLTISYDGDWKLNRQAWGFTNEYLRNIAEGISASTSGRTVYSGNYLTAFELQNNAQEVYPAQPVLMLDRLSTYAQLSSFFGQDSSMIFGTSLDSINRGIEISDDIVLADSDDLLLLANGRLIVKPSEFTKVLTPRDAWATGSVHHLVFSQFLDLNGISWSWPFDFGYGLAYTSASDARLELEAQVPEDGDYRVFVRYLSNSDGGSFDATVGNMTATVSTDREFGSKFEWADLGSHRFTGRSNDIVIENNIGSNVVNLIVLIPSASGDLIYDDLSFDLSSKNLIYLFEAEHDFEPHGSEETSTRVTQNGINFVNASALELGLRVVKDDTYRFAVRGDGDFSITIRNVNANESLDMEPDVLNFKYSAPVDLTKGTYQLQINGNGGSYLDYVMLYSQNDDSMGYGMFSNNAPDGNQVVSYERIDPTLHELHVKAREPFLLAFAEGYDKFWTAEIKTASGVKRYDPVELYDVINGFWIDEVGEYDISIRYQLQEWFYAGAYISAGTFASVVIYLLFSYFTRRSRIPMRQVEDRRDVTRI
jgi:hypothetical protein